MVVKLTKLTSGTHKFQAVFFDDKTNKKLKTVKFGARGYSDCHLFLVIHIVANYYIIIIDDN